MGGVCVAYVMSDGDIVDGGIVDQAKDVCEVFAVDRSVVFLLGVCGVGEYGVASC